ncbi:unnamed protein product [Bursaphelenchus xylophilus]|uniref:(pine wood nematode) hypothetical protein n=1 Tax=Bursaphelenchus xylophilus TaxID=6326 RepID=A0A1I7SSS2_BURXY|nr:unnamed protein product [Bursaphelenchus xylophilus]CAG9108900.1 unnamed protein product [Bursaphelenchus xylophilus]
MAGSGRSDRAGRADVNPAPPPRDSADITASGVVCQKAFEEKKKAKRLQQDDDMIATTMLINTDQTDLVLSHKLIMVGGNQSSNGRRKKMITHQPIIPPIFPGPTWGQSEANREDNSCPIPHPCSGRMPGTATTCSSIKPAELDALTGGRRLLP